MPLAATNLLSEYIKLCKTVECISGGTKIKLENNLLKFSRTPYFICLAFGILFGQVEIIEIAGKWLFQRNFTSTYHSKYNTVATIMTCGKVMTYGICLGAMKFTATQESLFNNLLRIEKTYWKPKYGMVKITGLNIFPNNLNTFYFFD